jgi:hypothetical protein
MQLSPSAKLEILVGYIDYAFNNDIIPYQSRDVIYQVLKGSGFVKR